MGEEEPIVTLRPEIAALSAYSQGRVPSPEGFKLSSNENPFPPLPGVLETVLAQTAYNRYPDAAGLTLRERLAERFGVSSEEVVLGGGSVSLLQQFALAAAGPGDEIVYAWRSFEAYPGIVTVTGARSVQIPLGAGAVHDLDAMARAITSATRVIIVCSPNNPTGPIVTADAFERFMAYVPDNVLVLLDEAYCEFVTDPEAVNGAELVRRYPNLVVLRTFSKAYGLAGLRVGYGIGPARLIRAAQATAIPFSVSDLALNAALASLDHEQTLLQRVAVITQRREFLRGALLAQAWAIPVAQGNFVWLPTGEGTGAASDAFFDADVAVRPFDGDGIRISVGEEEALERVIEIAATLPHEGSRP